MDIRSRHGFVILWDPEAVAEIVAERSMTRSTRGMTRLPRGVLGLRVSRHPWPAVAATQGLMEPPPREPRPRTPPRTSRTPRIRTEAIPSPATWILPDPPESLQEVGEGRRNNEVFDAVRFAVYKLPRGQGGEAMRIRWYELVLSQTEACNRDLPAPMRPARVVSTARSIARFTWNEPLLRPHGRHGTAGPGRAAGTGTGQRESPPGALAGTERPHRGNAPCRMEHRPRGPPGRTELGPDLEGSYGRQVEARSISPTNRPPGAPS